jgi:hypothetical protein
MFPRDPIFELQLAHERMAEFERQAEIMRLLREGRSGRPGLADRALFGVGVCLIRIGQWLRNQARAGSPGEQFPSW